MNEAMKEEWRTSLVGVRWVVETETGAHVTDFIQTKDQARLIAAAPELLAALKRLRDDVQTAHVGADERCKDCAVCWSLKLADAAIAKAEGKDQ